MLIFFLDTSAVIKYYHEEKGSNKVKEIINVESESTSENEGEEREKARNYISELTLIEFRSALFKKFRTGEINKQDRTDLINLFNSDILEGKFLMIPLGSVHLRKAINLLEKYAEKFPLRTLDSLQLSSSLKLAEHMREQLEFVCADQTLVEVARKCGLRALNPEIASEELG